MLLPQEKQKMRPFFVTLTVIGLSGWSQPAPQQPQPPITVKVETPPTPPKGFLEYLQGLGPLIAASVAVGVAGVQYSLQRQSQRQDLFDKRFTVYTSVEAYLVSLNTGNTESKEKLYGQYAVAARQAEFLFGPEIPRFIHDFYALYLERKCHREGDQEWCEATLELTRRLTDDVEPIFRPYLELHHEQSWLARFIARVNRWVDSDQAAVMASRYDA
jgi:hypothetical protein